MALTVFHHGRWTVSADVQATRKAYAEIAEGGSDKCECAYCRNFVIARDRGLVFSQSVLDLLESLGVDYRKDVEAAQLEVRNNWLLYTAWFHFVGSAEEVRPPDVNVPVLSVTKAQIHPEAEVIGEHLSIRLATGGWMSQPAFRGLQLALVDFELEIPWLLPEPCPQEWVP